LDSKLGICEWVFAVNGPTAIRYAAEIGFDGIQLGDLGGARNCFPLNDPKIQKDYQESARRYGIQLHSLHLFTLVREGHLRFPPNSPEGRLGIRSIQKGLEACQALDIPILLVTSYDACAIINEYDAEQTAKMLRAACDLARDMGVRITYESVTPTRTIKWILDYVGKDLKLCYDVLNPIKFLKGDPLEEIALFGPDVIDHVHVKDAPPELRGFCRLGTGRGRYRETIAALKQSGFEGWYITENFYHAPPMGDGGSVFELAKNDLDVMRATCGA
jgi:sugar phosphate isomerase/epimerase